MCPPHCDCTMSSSGDLEKKGVDAPSFEPEVVSVDRPSESEAVDRIYDMKSELGVYSIAFIQRRRRSYANMHLMCLSQPMSSERVRPTSFLLNSRHSRTPFQNRHGQIPVGTVPSVRLWLDGRQ